MNKIIKTEYRGKVTYSGNKSVNTCYLLNGSMGVMLDRSNLHFETSEECEEILKEMYNSEIIKYKGHRIQKRFNTNNWRICYVDLSWKSEPYGRSSTYHYWYDLESAKKDIDVKEEKPKKSIFKLF